MTRWVAAIAILLIVVAPSVLVTRGVGAQGAITVVEQGVENQFPDGLRFHLEAQSSTPIEEIRVYVRKLGQSSRSVYRTVEFEPGERISGEALFQSKTANEFIPTGTRLSYYFDIRTADGQRLETEPQVLVYLNRGLDWDSVSDGLINVYYYHHTGESENRANQVLEVAADTYAHMGPILGVELTEPMNLVVYSDYADMRVALPPKSRVAAQQLRTLGQAFTTERTLLVDGSSDVFVGDNILSTTAHEFTHLLVADAAGTAYGQVHTWLNEGLAVYSEGDNTEFGFYVNTAIRNDAVPPLASLRTYAGTPEETLRNYGLGHSVVTHMLETYGTEPMTELFANIRTMHNFERSLEAAYGLTIIELDNEWRESLGISPRELSTPVLPAFQAIPTRRPTPTPSGSAQQAPAPQATAAPTATPTYTLGPTATPVQGPPGSSEPVRDLTPRSSGGCGAAGAPAESMFLTFLAWPVALLVLAGKRYWRRK
ncbi:MAG: peptidase MA family metallohydrolase [Chloroflexota bacterium]|nr:peptidase MA family metallohydrolase [Chloroflexota bacterium]MDE2962168.1 peptidase MA family metallohydrolase [Chloroflexota bacterium]